MLNVRRDAACFQVDASIVIMSAEPPVMPSHSNALSAETGRARQRLADAHHDLAMIYESCPGGAGSRGSAGRAPATAPFESIGQALSAHLANVVAESKESGAVAPKPSRCRIPLTGVPESP